MQKFIKNKKPIPDFVPAMNFIKLKIEAILFGLLSIMLLLALWTTSQQDPTFFNQLYPSEGVNNWLGLMGALIAGSLLEIFGPSAFMLVWFLLRVPLHRPRRINVIVGFYYSIVILFLSSIFQEATYVFGLINFKNYEFIWQNGYSGRLALIWMDQTVGLIPGLSAAALMFFISIFKMIPVLTPTPLVVQFLSFLSRFKRMLVVKFLLPNNPQPQNQRPLPPFKGRSRIPKNNMAT